MNIELINLVKGLVTVNIYDYIKSKYLRLSKGQRKVAQFILEQPSTIVTNIASEVGRLAGVSESTVIRFCYAIELSGYGELQAKLNEYLTLKNTIASPRIEKKVTSDEVKGNMILHAKQISEVIQKIDSKQIMNAIHNIFQARHTYIIGFSDNEVLVNILHKGIPKSTNISEVKMLQEMLSLVNPEDIIILFDDRENENYFKNIFGYAEVNGLKVLFIHDRKNNPYRKKCAVNLYLGEEEMMQSFGALSFVISIVETIKQLNIVNDNTKELVLA